MLVNSLNRVYNLEDHVYKFNPYRFKIKNQNFDNSNKKSEWIRSKDIKIQLIKNHDDNKVILAFYVDFNLDVPLLWPKATLKINDQIIFEHTKISKGFFALDKDVLNLDFEHLNSIELTLFNYDDVFSKTTIYKSDLINDPPQIQTDNTFVELKYPASYDFWFTKESFKLNTQYYKININLRNINQLKTSEIFGYSITKKTFEYLSPKNRYDFGFPQTTNNELILQDSQKNVPLKFVYASEIDQNNVGLIKNNLKSLHRLIKIKANDYNGKEFDVINNVIKFKNIINTKKTLILNLILDNKKIPITFNLLVKKHRENFKKFNIKIKTLTNPKKLNKYDYLIKFADFKDLLLAENLDILTFEKYIKKDEENIDDF
ncbi:hypothetical protein V2E24_02280 [Mycoplasmopsis ciconiae]|uniref:Uncharacterized protein n=1 Tax=Mycoplasmopsis ciconiae TaxID=561067 RepID=A0ABU7MMV8_9BACT|nr:hypothetical protein [Mycoplasmopsis ciconiae]